MTNEDLIARYREGDASALDELYARNLPMLLTLRGRYGRKGDYDDALQEASVAFLKAVKGYRYGKFSTLLWSCACNQLCGWRKLRRSNPFPRASARQLESLWDTRSRNSFLRIDLKLDVQERLSERESLVIRMRLEGHELRSIGAATGLSVPSVCRVKAGSIERLSQ